MRSTVMFGAIAALIAGFVLADYSATAQTGSERTARNQLTAEQVTAKGDARIAGLKAALRLTSEQEQDWPGVERALHDVAKKRADRVIARRAERAQEKAPVAFPDQLRRRADVLSERSANLKSVADAVQTLYGKLEERQKNRFEHRVKQFVERGID